MHLLYSSQSLEKLVFRGFPRTDTFLCCDRFALLIIGMLSSSDFVILANGAFCGVHGNL